MERDYCATLVVLAKTHNEVNCMRFFVLALFFGMAVFPSGMAAEAATVPEQAFAQIDSPTAWTFDQVISATLTSDPRLYIGEEDIRQAEAEYLTSSLLPNPTFTAEGGTLPFKRITEDRPGGPPQLDLRVEFPIDWFL